MNNFQQLQAEEELLFKQGSKDQEVRNRLQGTMGFFQFIGNIVDVYVPKVMDCLIVTIGGNLQENIPVGKPKAPSTKTDVRIRAPKPDRPNAQGRD